MDSRAIVLSKESGLFFAGPDAPSPWGEEAHLAMQFASPSKAWRYATDLVRAQSGLLQGDPVELQIYDPISRKTTQAVSTADPYPVLRARWRRAFGEPLPLDIPDVAQSPEVARARLSDYLNATEWHAVRARGGDSFGFHPSFWLEADKLYRRDPQAFGALWSAVVPPDIAPPDLAARRSRLAPASGNEGGEPNEVGPPPLSAGAAAGMSDTDPDPDPPPYVARHFVAGRGTFYYRQRPDVLAFSIRGQSFRAHDDSVMTATAIVELARQRAWSALRVRGSTAFRRAVWAAASERGIRVFGYSPSRGEAAVLAQSASPDGHPSRASKDAYKPAAGRPWDDPLAGVVLDMGPAPYRHERANSESFYVTLRASDGREATHWGVDLERALKEAGTHRGDRVALERRGKRPVEVDRTVRDADGDVSYRKKEVVERRVWGIKVLDAVSPRADVSAPVGAGADPDLAKAVALLEKRMPEMPESLRKEFRQYFDAARSRLEASRSTSVASPKRSSQALSRSSRTR